MEPQQQQQQQQTLYCSNFLPALIHSRVLTPYDPVELDRRLSNDATRCYTGKGDKEGWIVATRSINRGELVAVVDIDVLAQMNQHCVIRKFIFRADEASSGGGGGGGGGHSESQSEVTLASDDDLSVNAVSGESINEEELVFVCVAMKRIVKGVCLYRQRALGPEKSDEAVTQFVAGENRRFKLFCDVALHAVRKPLPENLARYKEEKQLARNEIIACYRETGDTAMTGYFLSTVDDESEEVPELFVGGEILLDVGALYARLSTVANDQLVFKESLIEGAGNGIFVSLAAQFATHQLITAYVGHRVSAQDERYLQNHYRAKFSPGMVLIGDVVVAGDEYGALRPLDAHEARGVASFLNDNVLLDEMKRSLRMGHLTVADVDAMLLDPRYHQRNELANAELIRIDDIHNVISEAQFYQEHTKQYPEFYPTIDMRHRIIVARARRPVLWNEELYLDYGAKYWFDVLSQRQDDDDADAAAGEKKKQKTVIGGRIVY